MTTMTNLFYKSRINNIIVCLNEALCCTKRTTGRIYEAPDSDPIDVTTDRSLLYRAKIQNAKNH